MMKSMCCLCIQFTHENTSERTIWNQVNNKKSGGGGGGGGANPTRPSLPGLLACTAKKASYAPDMGTAQLAFEEVVRGGPTGNNFLRMPGFFPRFFSYYSSTKYSTSTLATRFRSRDPESHVTPKGVPLGVRMCHRKLHNIPHPLVGPFHR